MVKRIPRKDRVTYRLRPNRLEPYNRVAERVRFRARNIITRCELSGMKIAYATHDDALDARVRGTEVRGVALRIYRCGTHYHLTSRV